MNTCCICKTEVDLAETIVVEMKFLKTGRKEVLHTCRSIYCLPQVVESFEGDSTWSLSIESYGSYVERIQELASL